MSGPDLLFLVKTPLNYPRTLKARAGFTPEARSHAALASHRRKRSLPIQARRVHSIPSKELNRSLYLFVLEHSDGEKDQSQTSLEERSERLGLQDIERLLTPLRPTVDVFPGVSHERSAGFKAAAEFYSVVKPELVHAPVFHIFNVSNTFGKSYYEFMREEVSLHAGVAVVNMIRDVFRPDFRKTGPSQHVLRLIQVAMSKLRQRIEKSPKLDINDDASIVAAMFLGHMASGFGDFEAFRMHRRGIKAMVAWRGGLDALGLNGMLKASVSQFESWWTQIYGDSIFAEYKPPYAPVYLEEPLSAETSALLGHLPVGFQSLAKEGQIAVDILTVLVNIVDYEEQVRKGKGLAAQMVAVAQLSERKRYSDFWEACSCLLVSGPHFEKFLCFALFCYTSIAFSPERVYLSASHTAFRTPRLLLTKQLPDFRVDCPKKNQCLVWIWLVLIESWVATDGVHSETAGELSRQFANCCPLYSSWPAIEVVMRRFFYTDSVLAGMEVWWNDLVM